jgi:hypothetical protein
MEACGTFFRLLLLITAHRPVFVLNNQSIFNVGANDPKLSTFGDVISANSHLCAQTLPSIKEGHAAPSLDLYLSALCFLAHH